MKFITIIVVAIVVAVVLKNAELHIPAENPNQRLRDSILFYKDSLVGPSIDSAYRHWNLAKQHLAKGDSVMYRIELRRTRYYIKRYKDSANKAKSFLDSLTIINEEKTQS